jgi:hypothetical protein
MSMARIAANRRCTRSPAKSYPFIANQTDSGQNKLPPSDDRWKLRSETYAGIAEAFATQWGAADQFKLEAA